VSWMTFAQRSETISRKGRRRALARV